MSASQKLYDWRLNPTKFVYDNFGVEPDRWQLKVLEAAGGDYKTQRRIGMKACTGPGKSTVEAWLGWHRLACFSEAGEHPKGAALSGEGRDNLQDNLWAELSKWQQRSDFLKAAFTFNQERIASITDPTTWFLSARSYPKNANAEEIGRSLSGLHSRFPFLLLDETGGMPITVGQKAEQIFTGGCKDGLILAAGNPTSTQGLLYDITIRGVYFVVTITADPDDPDRTPRVDIELARQQIKTYGRDNPWVKATILGEFPESGFNTLLGPEEVEAAMKRNVKITDYEYSQKRLGVDVARFGSDSSVIFPRQGLQAFKPVILRNATNPDIAARVLQAKNKWGSEAEFVDGTGGYGAGVVDFMRNAGANPTEVHFSSKPIDQRYENRRAEMWFKMAEWVKRGGGLPNIPEIVGELTIPTYTFSNRGKFIIEPKEKVKERLGRSPDLADALCLTFCVPDVNQRETLIGRLTQKKIESEWDPFEVKE